MSGLPEGWAAAPIGELCTLINGRAFKPSDWSVSGLPIVRIQNLNDAAKSFNYFNGEVEAKYYIDDGELLFAWSGTPGTSFGAHIWSRGRAILNQHIFRVLLPEGLIDKAFFRFSINERLSHLVSVAHGGAGLAHVTKPVFEQTKVLLPPLNEQKRIVAKLDALQARHDNAKQALDAIPPLLDKLRQSILRAAFRGDLTREWRARNPDVEPASVLLERIRAERRRRWEEANPKKKYVEPEPVDTSDLPELPPHWSWSSIDEIAEISGGLTRNASKRSTSTNIVPLVTVAAVGLRSIDPTEFGEIGLLPSDGENATLEIGDILVVEGNGSLSQIGRGAMWDGCVPDARHQNHLIRIRTPLLPPAYVLEWLSSPLGRRRLVQQATSAAGLYNLSLSKVGRIPIPLAPRMEQCEISERLAAPIEACRGHERALEDAHALLNQLSNGLLAKAFRGELVPQDPNDEPASVLLERIRAKRAAADGDSGGKKRRGRSKG